MLKKIGKRPLRIGLILLLLILLLVILVRFPAIQTKIVAYTADQLSEKLQTEVEVGSVAIEFFKTIEIKDILVKDQSSDTLLSIEQLAADISLFSLFGKSIFINELELEGVTVAIENDSTTESFNYQFIIDAFSTNPPKDSTATGWDFGIDKLSLNDTHLRYSDLGADGITIAGHIQALSIELDSLDLDQKIIVVDQLTINNSKLQLTTLHSKDPPTVANEMEANSFPNSGWDIAAKAIHLNNNSLLIQKEGAKNKASFSKDYIQLDQESILLKEVVYAENLLAGQVALKQAKMAHLPAIENLTTTFSFSPRQFQLSVFQMATPHSQVALSGTIDAEQFSALFSPKQMNGAEVNISDLKFSAAEIKTILTSLNIQNSFNPPKDEFLLAKGKINFHPNKESNAVISLTLGKWTNLIAQGRFNDLFNDPYIDLQLEELNTEYLALKEWIPDSLITNKIAHLGKIKLTTQAKGRLDDFALMQTKLTTGTGTNLLGDIQIKNIEQIKTAQFQLDFEQLQTVAKDIQPFLPGDPSALIDSLGFLDFAGTFAGTITDFQINGNIITAPGQINSNAHLRFAPDYADANYEGEIKMNDFDLGVLLNDSLQLGAVTLSAALEGKGLQPDSLDIKVKGNIDALEYNNYNYQDVVINGEIEGLKYQGKATSNDKNLKFNFDGLVDANTGVPTFQANLKVDTINLQPLNFYTTPLSISATLAGNFQGNNFDDLLGTIDFNHLSISDSLHTFSDSTIELTIIEWDDGSKHLDLTSSIMDGKIIGNYELTTLVPAFSTYLDGYFPIKNNAIDTQTEFSSAQSFTFFFHPKNLQNIGAIFLGAPIDIDSSSLLKGSFDANARDLKADINLFQLSFDDILLDTLNLAIDGNESQLLADLDLSALNFKNKFFANQFQSAINLKDQQAKLTVHLLDNADSTLLRWGGGIDRPDKNYQLIFDELLTIGADQWRVDSTNNIQFENNLPVVHNLKFNKDQESIAIASEGTAAKNERSDLSLTLNQFSLNTISKLINIPNTSFNGIINGQGKIFQPLSNPHMLANLAIEDFALNGQEIGEVKFKAEQKINANHIDLALNISGNNKAVVLGDYMISNQQINLDADLQKLSLVLIDPFLIDIIQKSQGHVKGKLKVKGDISSPSIQGTLTTHNLSTIPIVSGVRYTNDGGKIILTDQEIILENFELKDPASRIAVLTGGIKHNRFSDMRLGLNLTTNGIKILDTPAGSNDLYYGKIITQATADISGPFDLVQLDVTASTLDSTKITVLPLAENYQVKQEDYIIFGKPTADVKEDIEVVDYKASTTGYNLEMQLEVTEAAKMNIVIDPLTGDRLEAFGGGNLNINMTPDGAVDVIGNYELTDGTYFYTYEKLAARNFDIQKGSSLVFIGDPLATKFDITANYETETSTAPLIQNEVTNESELQEAYKRSKVQVVMNIAGDIEEPEFTFDLKIPSASNAIENTVAAKMQSLKNNPSELNKQVFGLLLFNSFIASGSSSTFSSMPENFVLGSVSDLISNQLNNLANKIFKGVDVKVDFDSYNTASTDSENISQLNLGVSKRFFDDRLTLKAGGDFSMATSQSSTLRAGNSTAIAGNFVIEYKLDKSGNYLLRVFHDTDYQTLLDANSKRSGLGIQFNKSY